MTRLAVLAEDPEGPVVRHRVRALLRERDPARDDARTVHLDDLELDAEGGAEPLERELRQLRAHLVGVVHAVDSARVRDPDEEQAPARVREGAQGPRGALLPRQAALELEARALAAAEAGEEVVGGQVHGSRE